jgi:D-beta-D-heptose 7-phosphate kinase/D-beta-D-heptose 1-phosphate adenosyltransferase
MLDRYLSGQAGRVSQEAPVLVLRHQGQTENPGGAGNVACNLAGLGLGVRILGAVGEDVEGHRLIALLRAAGVDVDAIVHCSSRPTTTKSRVTSGRHQLLRIDVEHTTELSDSDATELIDRLKNAGRTADPKEPVAIAGSSASGAPRAIVISDYAKGVVTPALAQTAIGLGRELGVPVLVDPKGPDWSKYRGATGATPNRLELAEAAGIAQHDLDGLLDAGERLRRELELEFLAVTLGEQGIALLNVDGVDRFPSQAREVFDVSGAGDTVLAAITLALMAGLSCSQAMPLANLAAGLVVGRTGTVPITRRELCEEITRFARPGHAHKICDATEAAQRAAAWRRAGHKIVFTNGCFDLVHAGHALHLEEARGLGDRLVIGLNSDDSIRELKGPARPIQCQRDRAILLAALQAVDAVVIFDEPTPLNLVLAIRPDVMVKGDDYVKSAIAGAAEVESWGGQVVTLPLVAGRSTSRLIERIRASTSDSG